MSALALKFLLVLSLVAGALIPALNAQEEKTSQRGPDAVARDFYVFICNHSPRTTTSIPAIKHC